MLDEKIILKFLRGECNEQELQAIKSHIDQSDEAAEELFKLRQTYRMLEAERMSDAEVNAAYNRLNERLSQKVQARKAEIRHIKMRRIASVAASIVAVVAIGVVLLWHRGNSNMLVAQAPDDSVIQVSLIDGTKVWLHNGAKLRYPKSFNNSVRKVELQGEGYFEVAKDRIHPFLVQGNSIKVKVLGTKFAFKATGKSSQVNLLEGSVEVQELARHGMVMLSPGQTASIDSITGTLRVSERQHAELSAIWHDDLIPFSNATVAEIARTLQYIYHEKIYVADDVDTATTYTGSVKRKGTVEDVLEALTNTLPITYKKTTNHIVLSNK